MYAMNPVRPRRRLLVSALSVLLIVLLGAGVIAFLVLRHRAPGPAQRGTAHSMPAPPGTATGAPLPSPSPGSAQTPMRLEIPRIAVDAAIESVGETATGNMDVPRRVQDVGWYAPGVVPGQPGDAVIDGHLDWYTGPAVFAQLGALRPGDTIAVIFGDGHSVNFAVDSSTAYDVQAEPSYLFSTKGPAELSLITCAGSWDGSQYTKRLVVNATPVS